MLLIAACGGSDSTDQASTAEQGSTSEQGSTADQESVDAGDATPASTSTDAGQREPTGNASVDAVPFPVEQIQSSPIDVVASALDAWTSGIVPTSFPEPLIETADLRSGGPPPDGIPPVDEPRFLHPGDVDFLADNEPVLALEIDGDARAYPVQVLTWHEIVNDTVGGVPVSVTYCPLCNSALAYDRRVEIDDTDEVLDFGTSGLLFNSSLVMYDRQTQSLWSHFTGQAVMGELTGLELDDFAVATVAWSVWRDAHPDGLVLSRETGFDRQYGRNPYPGYDDVDGVPFLFEGEVDGRYTALTRILGFEADGAVFGVPMTDLQERRVITGALEDSEFVAWWTAGTSSALDSSNVADGYDVGATGLFVAAAEGDALTFRADADLFTDDQTGSTWNVLGQAVDGPLKGTQLEPLPHVDTFWFAWSTFHPDTTLVTGKPSG